MRTPLLLVWGLFLSFSCAPRALPTAPAPSPAASAPAVEPAPPLHAAIRLLSAPSERNLRVEVRFDQPMRDLLSPRPAGSLLVSLSPALRGDWSWGDRSSIVFTSAETPVPGSSFSFLVPAGISSLLGGSLVEAVEGAVRFGSFSALTPGNLENALDVWADHTSAIVFNEEIDAASVDKNVELFEVKGGERIARPSSVFVRQNRLFVRSKSLLSGGRFSVQIRRDLRSSKGSTIDAPLRFDFDSDQKPRLRLVCRRSNADQPCEGESFFVLSTTPVSPEMIGKHLRIAPALDVSLGHTNRDLDHVLDEEDARGATLIEFRANLSPGARYRASIAGGKVRDTLGRAVEDGASASLVGPALQLWLSREEEGKTLVQGPPWAAVKLRVARVPEDEAWAQISASGSELLSLWKKHARGSTQLWLDGQGQAKVVEAHLLPPGSGFFIVGAETRGAPVAIESISRPSSLVLRELACGSSALWQALDARGRPLEGASVEAREAGERGPFFSAKTGPDGLIEIEKTPGRDFYLLVSKGAEQDLSRQSCHRASDPHQGGLFVDRAVYTAGDVVRVRGVRRPPSGAHEAFAGRALVLSLEGASRGELARATAQIDAHGFFSAELPVPAILGAGQLGHTWVAASGAGLRGGLRSPLFELREFRRPEMSVKASFDREEYVDGDTIRCSAEAALLSGERLASGKASFSVAQKATWPAELRRLDRSIAGLVYDNDSRTRYPKGEPPSANLGLENGLASHSFKASTGFVPLEFMCRVSVQENNLSSEDSARAVVHPAEFYLLPRATLSGDGAVDVVVDVLPSIKGSELTPSLSAVLQRSSVNSEQWISEAHCSNPAGKQLRCRFLREDTLGQYRVAAHGVDSRGHRVSSSAWLRFPERDEIAHPPASPPHKWLKIEAHPGDARGGEPFSFSVRADTPSRAMIVLDTPGEPRPLWYQPVDLKAGENSLQAPLPRLLPPSSRLFVDACPRSPGAGSVLGGCSRDSFEIRAPERRQALQVRLDSTARETSPGGEVRFDIQVSSPGKGSAVPAEVTFFLVDEGVASLGRWKQPSAMGLFFSPSEHGSALSLGYREGDLAPWEDPTEDRQNDRQMAGALLASASFIGSYLAPPTRTSLTPRLAGDLTVCYRPALVVDHEGKTSASCRLPADLTTYRAVAVAIGRDGPGSGSASTLVTTRLPLSIRPVMPRVARVGDRLQAGGLLINGSGAAIEARVEAATKGSFQGDWSGKFSLKPGELRRFSWPVIALSPGKGRVLLKVDGGALADASESHLDVLPPAGEEVSVQVGDSSEARSIELKASSPALGDAGQVTVVAAGSPAVGIFADLQSLIEYPYGCTEQTVSRLVPLVIVRDLARASGVELPADIDKVARDAVTRLIGHQQEDGSFGLWPSSAPEVWVTAYALWGLRAVRDRGVEVRHGVIEKASSWLFAISSMSERGGSPSDVDPLVLDLLSDPAKSKNPSWQRLFAGRAALSLSARAVLLRGLARAGLKEEAARLGDEIAPAILALEENGFSGRFSSKTGLLALLLRGRLAQGHPQADELAKALAAGRRGGRHRSTQDSASVLLALDEYFKARPGSLDAGSLDVSVQGDRRTLGWAASGAASSTWPLSSLSSGARVELVPSGKAHHEVWLRYLPAEQPSAPRDEGIFLLRAFSSAAEGDLWNSLRGKIVHADRFKLGATVIVSAVFELRHSTRDLALSVPVPAGLEIAENNGLDGCRRLPSDWHRSSAPTSDPEGTFFHDSFEHCEMRGDRAVFFLRESPAGVHRVSFAARAATAGHFHAPPAVIEAMYGPQRGTSAGGGFAVVEPQESLALAAGAGG